jgi:hypothetical protein
MTSPLPEVTVPAGQGLALSSANVANGASAKSATASGFKQFTK